MVEKVTLLGSPYANDDRVVLLANFLADYLADSDIEIEAKVGTYRFREMTPRVSHITLLDPRATPFSFQSSVDPRYFDTLQHTLRSRGLKESVSHTEDLVYDCNEPFAKERKTVETATQTVVECSHKAKLYDLNFLLNPDSCLGIRISANKEYRLPAEPTGKFLLSRVKHRSSFAYEYFSLDMTKVLQQRTETCEVELEISDPNFVRGFVGPFLNGADRNSLFSIAHKFWQNALALAQYRAPLPAPVWRGADAEVRVLEANQQAVFRQVFSSEPPLVGDYLYTVARELANG